jgi:hypothetical protein
MIEALPGTPRRDCSDLMVHDAGGNGDRTRDILPRQLVAVEGGNQGRNVNFGIFCRWITGTLS